MIEVEDVKNWLRDGEDFDAASLIEQCELSYEFIDIAFPIFEDGPDFEIYTLKIHAPRKILKDLPKYKTEIDKIEAAIKELSQADSGFYIENINWVALKGKTESSPSDAEIQKILSNVDAPHIKSAWEKAIDRRVKDPDGALTAARTLIETVCKHILTNLNIEFSENDDINNLYSLTSKALEISASQDIDKESKKIFGNINAIVSGVAFYRNKLGDAHGQYEKNELLINELGELSVNLAGSICTFLIKAFEKKKDRAKTTNKV
ncbi:MAG: abortive infection family protein [Candidatus Methanoperedens sp.]